MSILSIRLFGDSILRQQTKFIKAVDAEIQKLIADMIETMHNAEGIGLAAPQVGRLERLFVVDVSGLKEAFPEQEVDRLPDHPMVFINPEITWESEGEEEFEEGCLSIPDIREPVFRPEAVQITYQDRNMQEHSLKVDGILARVIQHEYDHLEGVLFTDYISVFRRTMLKRKLAEISCGMSSANYPVQTA